MVQDSGLRQENKVHFTEPCTLRPEIIEQTY
jgi:hypothetical protein